GSHVVDRSLLVVLARWPSDADPSSAPPPRQTDPLGRGPAPLVSAAADRLVLVYAYCAGVSWVSILARSYHRRSDRPGIDRTFDCRPRGERIFAICCSESNGGGRLWFSKNLFSTIFNSVGVATIFSFAPSRSWAFKKSMSIGSLRSTLALGSLRWAWATLNATAGAAAAKAAPPPLRMSMMSPTTASTAKAVISTCIHGKRGAGAACGWLSLGSFMARCLLSCGFPCLHRPSSRHNPQKTLLDHPGWPVPQAHDAYRTA